MVPATEAGQPFALGRRQRVEALQGVWRGPQPVGECGDIGGQCQHRRIRLTAVTPRLLRGVGQGPHSAGHQGPDISVYADHSTTTQRFGEEGDGGVPLAATRGDVEPNRHHVQRQLGLRVVAGIGQGGIEMALGLVVVPTGRGQRGFVHMGEAGRHAGGLEARRSLTTSSASSQRPRLFSAKPRLKASIAPPKLPSRPSRRASSSPAVAASAASW